MIKRTHKKGLIFVVSGPSGSGKTTLVGKLFKDRAFKRKFARSVSFTTRPRRLTEKEGRDYFFISKQEFQKYLLRKKILEWTRYLGYYYATPRDFADKQLFKGKNMFLCLDQVGARRIKKIYGGKSVTIFINPPSLERLRQRIVGRGKKTGECGIAKRLAAAKKELLGARLYDYNVTNNDLKKALLDLKKIVSREINRAR